MLVPLLALPVRDPLANLLVQDWLLCVTALLTPLVIARWLAGPAGDWIGGGLIANLLLLVLARPEVVFDWFIAQPYAMSICLGGAALLAAERPGRVSMLVACATMFLAHWVNIGVAMLLIPLVLLRRRHVVRSLVIVGAGAAAGAALIPLSPYRTPTSTIPLAEWPAAWSQLLAMTPTPLNYPVIAGVVVVLGVLVAAAFLTHRRRDAVGDAAAVALITASLYWLAIGTSRWVQMNLFYPRYIYPTYVLVGVATGLIATALLRRHATLITTLAVVSLVFCTAVLYGPPSPRRLVATLDERFGVMTPDIITTGATVVGGEYWTVWPAVFHANLTTYRQRGAHRPIYGLTFRSTATNELWSHEPNVLVAARTGDRALDEFATRAALSLMFVDHRPTLDLFSAKPDASAERSAR